MAGWDDIIKGTSGSDIINGGSGDDFIQGRAGGDFLDGGDGNDTIQGNEGDDYIRGGAGNDFIHGGTGTDTAVYSGSVNDYAYSRNGEEFFLNHVGGSMIDGYDRLISIERLVFADAVIDLTQNNAPIAFNDTASTDEDNSVSGNVLANDFDWEGGAMTATPGVFNGVYGTLTLNANGTYTYTPYASTQSLALGQNVTDSFTYTVSDGSLSDTGTLTVTIAGRNDAPVANPDTASTGENSPVTIDVLANDTDVDNGAVLTVTSASAPSGQGSASIVANQIVFDPGTAFDHLDTGETAVVVVSYTITDEHGATSSSTVMVTVNGANDAPVANDDAASTSENAAVSGNVLANDTDVDVETLTVANPGVYVGAYGTLTLAADGSYTYAPNGAAQGLDDGETAQDVFSYTASDGTASDTATLTITVNGANDAPVANDDAASTTEDSAVSGNVLANDTDVDGETLTVVNPGVYVGAYGTLTLAADGSYSYAPNATAQGLDDGESVQDSFAYAASDGTASDSATLTVTVTGANDAPVANDDIASTSEDGSASGNVLANDTDVDGETLTVTNPGVYAGAYGTLTLAADGSYTYAPNGAAQGLDVGEVAQDVFSYTASDGTASDTSTLTVTVTGLNDAPVANDDMAATTEDSGVSGNVLANDTDVDGETLTVANPGTLVGIYGTLTLAADGNYTYAPNAAANGLAAGQVAQDVFTYTASDGTASDTATLTITVTGVNDAPTIDAGGTDASGSVTELPDGDAGEDIIVHTDSGSIAFDDVDLTDTHTAGFTAQGSGYLGTFTLDPVDQGDDSVGWDFSVSDAALASLEEGEVVIQTYTIMIDDGHGGTATQDVTITLTGASDTPSWYIDNSAVGSTNQGTQDNPFTSIAAFNASAGPGEGDVVYLLYGTGTYAEADGINLQDGQTLIGVASILGDPTIAPTAGDGVNVGENNTISGIDINSGSNSGIADSGGSVGALSVSDVDITTTSGNGIDIDGGGAGVSIADTTIATGSGYAILGANIAGFALADSTVSSGASSAGTIYLIELTGAAAFLGNTLNGGGGDNLGIANTTGSVTVTIADSGSNDAVVGPNDTANGDDGVSISTSGTASLTLTVDGVEFQGARSDLLEVLADGNSSQDLTITGNVFNNGQASSLGGGVVLRGGGAGSDIDVDFNVEGNSFTGASGSALTASYSQQAGDVTGNIEGNTIGTDDDIATAEGSSAGGSGIAVSLEKAAGPGTATFSVSIVDNDIRDIDGGAGIFLRSNGDGVAGSAVLEATISGNTVDEMGQYSVAALYAQVGGNGPGDFAELGLDLSDNILDFGNADFGNAVYLDQGSFESHFNFPGYSGSADGEFWGGTASADLDAFFAASGNALTNSANPFFPGGGVDAQIILGATGDAFLP